MKTRNAATPKTPVSKKTPPSKKSAAGTSASTASPSVDSTTKSAAARSASAKAKQAKNVSTQSPGSCRKAVSQDNVGGKLSGGSHEGISVSKVTVGVESEDHQELLEQKTSSGTKYDSPRATPSKQVTPGRKAAPKRKIVAKTKTSNSEKTTRSKSNLDNAEKEMVKGFEKEAGSTKNGEHYSEGAEVINDGTGVTISGSITLDSKETTNVDSVVKGESKSTEMNVGVEAGIVDERIEKIWKEAIEEISGNTKTTENVASGNKKATSVAKSMTKKKTAMKSKIATAGKTPSSSATKPLIAAAAKVNESTKNDDDSVAADPGSTKNVAICSGSVAMNAEDDMKMSSNIIGESEPMEVDDIEILDVKKEVVEEAFNDDGKDEKIGIIEVVHIKNVEEVDGRAESDRNKVEESIDVGKIVGRLIPGGKEVSHQVDSLKKVAPDARTVLRKKTVVKKKTPSTVNTLSSNTPMSVDVTKGNVEDSATVDDVAVVSDSESMEITEVFSEDVESVMGEKKLETVGLMLDGNLPEEKEVVKSEKAEVDIKEKCEQQQLENKIESTNFQDVTIEELSGEQAKSDILSVADAEHYVEQECFEEHENEGPAYGEELKGEDDEEKADTAGSGDEMDHEEQMELTVHAKERKTRKELEIFVGGLDRDAKEDDIKRTFDKVGDVVEIRLHKDPLTNKNKGYAFVKFAKKEQAKQALLEMKNPVIYGKRCGVSPSEDNDTLFLGNICNTWTREAVMQKLKDYDIVGVENVALVKDPRYEGLSRGFAFVEFSCHTDAMLAFKRLQKPDVIFGHPERTAKVAFAEPLREAAPEIMAQVKSVFIDGLPPHWDEDRVREQFKCYGVVEKVMLARNMSTAKRKDFGFVDFDTHDAAVACINGINSAELVDSNSKINAKARLSNPLPKTQAVKGKMAGGLRIGRGASTYQHYGRGFGRFVYPSNKSGFQRGRGFHHYGRGWRTGYYDEHNFSDTYGKGSGRRGMTGPSKYDHGRSFSSRGSFSGNYSTGRRFVYGESDHPYFYGNTLRGTKRPFYMTDPGYVEGNRPCPRLDYTDPGTFAETRYSGNLEPSRNLYSHDYYHSNRGGAAPSSAHGFGRSFRGGYY